MSNLFKSNLLMVTVFGLMFAVHNTAGTVQLVFFTLQFLTLAAQLVYCYKFITEDL